LIKSPPPIFPFSRGTVIGLLTLHGPGCFYASDADFFIDVRYANSSDRMGLSHRKTDRV